MSFQRFNLQTVPALFAALLMGGLSGCKQELNEFCSGSRDPIYRDAIVALQPWKGKDSVPGRAPASLKMGAAEAVSLAAGEMGLQERESWQRWAEDELKRTQNVLDWVAVHRDEMKNEAETRMNLSQAADELVAFHGYTQQGRATRMIATLEKLEARQKKLKTLACP